MYPLVKNKDITGTIRNDTSTDPASHFLSKSILFFISFLWERMENFAICFPSTENYPPKNVSSYYALSTHLAKYYYY